MKTDSIPSLDSIRAAAERLAGHAHRTPVLTSASLDDRAGASLFFKAENFQRVGAFKFRGAMNAVLALDETAAARGVVAHSSGNHAQALSLAAKLRGIPAYVVMPHTAPEVKVRGVQAYGGQITFCEPTLAARESTQAEVIARTGAHEVHPFNNPDVISGQGTATLELLADVPDLDVVLAPVGGGGLLSGTAIAAKSLKPGIQVFGCEPLNADDAKRSFETGVIQPSPDPVTVADGLRTSLGPLTFEIIRRDVDGIITVTEDEIVAAMRFVWERMKVIIEPSSAVPVAVALSGRFAGRRVGLILSGGNVDLERLPWLAKG